MSKHDYFFTFGEGRLKYRNASFRLAMEARASQSFQRCDNFGISTIKGEVELESFFKNNWFERNHKGYGYWLWKPFLLRKILVENIGKYRNLVYLDAGYSLNLRLKKSRDRLDEYLSLSADTGGLNFQLEHSEIQFSKKELLSRFPLTKNKLWSGQVSAGAIILKCDQSSLELIEQWIDLSTVDYGRLLVDHDIDPQNENPEFVGHRHDQSIFSLTVKSMNFGTVIQDETYFDSNFLGDGSNFPIWCTRHISLFPYKLTQNNSLARKFMHMEAKL